MSTRGTSVNPLSCRRQNGFAACSLDGLVQDHRDVTILIDGPSEALPCAIDGKKDFVQVPCVTGSGMLVPELMGISVSELQAPWLSDGATCCDSRASSDLSESIALLAFTGARVWECPAPCRA
jgi:hypothetical protein